MWILLLLACAEPMCISVTEFAVLCGISIPERDIFAECVAVLSALVAGRWLVTLVRARYAAPRIAIAASSALTFATVAALLMDTELSKIIETLATTAVMTWLGLEVVVHHGVTMRDFGFGRSAARREAGALLPGLIFCAHRAATWVTTVGMAWLAYGLPASLPVMREDQGAALGWEGAKAFAVSNVIYTSAIEEILMVGALCVLSQAARRPVWQIYAIGIAFRVMTHLYLGLPAIALAILGAASIFLYRRWGRIQPLVLNHLTFDLLVIFPIIPSLF
ncbi:type II CAAX prenyl endopeptidase Rce1 family protein [Streptomyces sp. NPDC021098]|uniref:CPBP family glutamic-type intramembrane protease n=1 Tax=unclassified Streptomyces TaxID=2593676 RepID=UPI0037BCCE0A